MSWEEQPVLNRQAIIPRLVDFIEQTGRLNRNLPTDRWTLGTRQLSITGYLETRRQLEITEAIITINGILRAVGGIPATLNNTPVELLSFEGWTAEDPTRHDWQFRQPGVARGNGKATFGPDLLHELRAHYAQTDTM